MAQVSEKHVEEFIELSKQKGIIYKTRDEARQAANRLVHFFEILIEIDQQEVRRKRRLEKEPTGFAIPAEGRSCFLCGNYLMDVEMWYDKWGLKCMNCQSALNKKIIPGYVFKDTRHEKSITDSQLAHEVGMHIQTIRKLIRRGELQARRIPGGPFVLLRHENPTLTAIIEKERSK